MKKFIQTIQYLAKCCNVPLVVITAMLILLPEYLFATVFTVSSTADSGPGTLRQAITNANADVNTPHTINFSIAAGSTITLAATALPNITRTMIIDATTTTGWTSNAIGVTLDATSNTGNQVFNVVNVPGFEIYGFQIIGGASTSFGILINGENADDFKIGAINKRNVINRAGNTIIKVISADNGFIQNNYIGCDVTGTSGYYGTPSLTPPNSGSGLWLDAGANGNTIGGSATGQGNLIAGGTGIALLLGTTNDASPGNSGCSNNIIYGNRIGGPGTLQFWSCVGIWIDGNSDNNIIGGVLPGQANDLSYCSNGNSCDGNGGSAVRIRSAEAQGNAIRGNVMQCAPGVGIRLISTGSNNNQSSPTLSTFNTTTNILTGTSTTPNAIIDVYLGSDCNGNFTTSIKSKLYLGSTTADASGNWSVNLSSVTCFLNGEYLTATVTNPTNGSTGPFASGLLVTLPTPAVYYPPGTYTVGPTGTFCSLKGVAAFLNLFTISGAYIFELQPTYNGSNEATPIVFNNNLGSSASNSVTIRPALGATNLLITNGNADNTIRLNGMDFLTFDGRAGGTGTNRNLSIETFNNMGASIMLTNDAVNNTIRFCNVRGGAAYTGAGGSSGGMIGIIEINTLAGSTTGCDNNTIANCLIANNNSSTLSPICGVYCRGLSNAAANNNIVIRNNEFNGIREYGYNGANKYSGIIHFDAFNSAAVIEGNSIYQSTAYDIPLQSGSQIVTQYGIYIHNGAGYSVSGTSVINLTGSGNNFIVRDNFIGGSGPGCTGTWTVNAPTASSGQYRFIGIYVQGHTNTPVGSLATIEGNTIKNISWGTTAPFLNTAPQLAVWGGIVVVGGQAAGVAGRTVTIGTSGKPNIIGDNLSNGSITVTNAGTAAGNGMNLIGIQVQGMGSGNATIEYNQIGGITATSTNGAGRVATIEGIRVDDGNNVIRFNSIGSSTLANSFNITASATTYNAAAANNQIQRVRGIVHTGGTATTASTTIANNTIANLRMNYAATATGPGAARGIVFDNPAPANVRGAIQIQNNNIFNLTSNQNFAASGATANVVGIDFNLSGNTEAANTDISGNNIYGLTTNGSSAITNAVGIYYSGRSAGTQSINGNFIRDFASNNINQSQTAIEAAGGVATYSNNIIYLGRNGTADITTHNIFNGISETGGTNQFYFNTSTIGGTATVAGANNTFGFITTVNSGARNIRNNIFFNARSNSAGTSKHYGISLPGNTGLTINNNNYFISGTGGVLGRYNAVDNATLLAWQGSTTQDAASQSINPTFTANIANGTGTGTATNYRPTGTGIIAGTAVVGVTTDYSGTYRSCNNTLGAFELAPTAPNLQITNPAAVCSPNTVNLNAVGVINDLNSTTGTTSYFTNLANAISNTSPIAITTAVSASGTYFIRKTAGCGFDVKPVTVTINPLPTPSFTVSSSNVCAGSTGVVFTSQTGMTGYTWNITGAGNSIASGSGTNSIITAWGSNGGNVTLNYTDPNGCSAASAISQAVTVTPLAAPTFTATGSTPVCQGAVSNVFTTQTGRSNYLWSVVGGNITAGGTSTSNSATITWNTPGNGIVAVNYSNAASPLCFANSYTTANVTVNAPPAITAQPTAPTVVCSGAGIQTLSVTATGAGLNYSWRRGGTPVTNGGVFSGQGTASLTLTNPAATDAGSYDVVITGTCTPAVTSSAVTVSVNPLPQGSISGNTVCLGGQSQFTFTATAGTGPYTLIIDGTTYTNVVSGTPFNGPAPSSTTSYTLTSITDANGCVRTTSFTGATATLTINTAPAITTQPLAPSATCTSNGTQTLIVAATGTGLTYSWRKGGVAVTNGGVFSGQGTNTLTLTNPAVADAGSYDVVISGTCPSPVTSNAVNVTVNPLPQGSIAGNTICSGNQSQFTFTASTGTGPFTLIVGGTTYTNVISGTSFNGPSPITTTPYTLTSITDANGCVRTTGITAATATVTVNTAPSIITQPLQPAATCTGSGTRTISVLATGTGLTYSWRKGGVAIVNGGIYSGQGTNTLTITNPLVADAGSYDVVISGTCTPDVTSNAVLLNVSATPVAIAGGSQTICEDGTATAPSATATNGSILWTHNGSGQFSDDGSGSPGATSTLLTPTYVATAGDAGLTRTLTLTVSNAPCSNAVATHTVIVKAIPTASAGGSASICQNGSHTLTGVSSANGTRLWTHNGAGSFNGGLATSSLLLPTYTADAADSGNTVILTLTVSNPPCADAVVTYTINVSATPTASGTGPIQTCENGAITVSGVSATNGTISWSILNGNGNLANTSTLTPTYTPVAADAGTTVVLRLSVSNPPCADAIYDQQIQIRPRPTLSTTAVNICTGNPFQQIDVVSPQLNTDYKWSPANDLYLDAALTIPYTLGTAASTVWTAPFGNVTYNVSATNTTDNCVTGNTPVAVTVCPAANDAICQALPVNVTSTSTFVNYSLTGSTPSIFAACAPVARDIYFSAVVPANGEINVITLAGNNSNASLNIVSSVVQILTGACTSPTAVYCDANGGSGNMSFAHTSGLSPGSTVYIRLARTGGLSTAQFVRMAVTSGLVWTAAADDDFNNPANWHGGDATALTKPDATISAIIPHNVTKPKLYANSTARGMNFTTGAPYFVSPGINLNGLTLNVKGDWLVGPSLSSSLTMDCNGTVEFNGSGASAQSIGGKTTFGNLTTNNTVGGVTLTNNTSVSCILKTTAGNLSSSGFLSLRSNNTTTALVNPLAGNVTGNVSVERKIGSITGYHYLSSPVSNGFVNNTTNGWRDDFTILSALDGIVFIPGTTYSTLPTVWEYDETNTNPNPAYGWRSATGTTDALTPLKGFACIVTANTVVDVFGTLNNGTIPGGYNITKTTGTGVGEGLNAIGNPYASPISWNAFRALPGNSTLLSTSGYQAFIASGGYAGTYGSWDGAIGSPVSVTDKIASSQGIMVTALGTGAINAANSARLTTAADLNPTFFSGYNSVPDLMRLEVQGNGYANETAIYFDPTSVDNFDIHRDARFVSTPVADVPTVYSYIDNTPLNINVMGKLNMDKVVPLGVKIQTAGTYNLVATDMSSFSPSVVAYLEDTQAGTMTNLRTNPSYSVSLPVGEINNRFYIHFHPAVELNAVNETCAGNDGKLVINYPTSNTVNVVIKDENGTVVNTQNNLSGTVTINNMLAGNYVAEMTFGVAPNTYTTSDYFTVAGGNAVYANLSASANTVDMSANTTVNFTATAQGAISFNWNFGDGTVVTNGPANMSHTFAQAGTYNVTFEASNGICNTVATTTVEVTNATGLVAINNSNLQVVGVGSKVTVRFGNKMEGTGNIEVINMLGEVVAHLENVSMKGTREIERANIATGQYLVKIVNNNKLYTEKVFLSRQE